MARKPGSTPQAMRNRAAKTAAAIAPTSALAQPATPKKPFNPAQFFREVRAEGRKITWTSRRETWITSVMVAIMVVVASIFLAGSDALLTFVVNKVLSLASAART